jgi:putative Mg2+ transporter-C (MgtC) family protein
MMDFFSNLWLQISSYLSSFYGFHWLTFLNNFFKIIAAFVIALPLALEREYYSRSLGLRTFPLVAVASCGYVIIAESFIGADNPDAKARIMQGLMTGIGLIGGGAILKEGKGEIIGTATAVSLWSTGTVGAAIAFDRFEIAIIVAGLNFVALRVLSPIKETMENGDSFKDEKKSSKK